MLLCFSTYQVFINKSKIHFESKSQLHQITASCYTGYLSISQRYILKANHNIVGNGTGAAQVFINKSKIHFESKSQPLSRQPLHIGRYLSISQRYILKANHNLTNK